MTLSKIMVILDPTREQQPAFDRGLDSAHMTGARLHLYGCLGTGQQEEASPANTARFREGMTEAGFDIENMALMDEGKREGGFEFDEVWN